MIMALKDRRTPVPDISHLNEEVGMSRARRAAGLVLAIVFLLAAVEGFATGQQGTPAGSGLKVTVMLPVWGENIKADNPVLLALSKHIGAELSIISVPKDVYTEKVDVAIASQELPTAVVVWDQKRSSFLNAARGGMFWNVSPYLKDYPSFKDINPVVAQNASIDGKLYGIPRERALIRRVISIRADWLRKLRLNPPGTLDELYAVAKAFTTGDPDGNGKQDTLGLAVGVNPTLEGLDVVAVANGAPNQWGEKDGKLVPMFMSPEFFGALKWYKKLYDEKLLNQDFVTVKDSYTDFFETEKAGTIFDWVCSYKGDPLYDARMKADPSVKDGDVVDQYFLETKEGTVRVPAEKATLGLLAFPKKSVTTESELKRVLAALSKLDDKVSQNLMAWGIEGVHYQLKDGAPVILDAAAKKSLVEPLGQLGLALSGDRTQRYISYAGDPALARIMALSTKYVKNVVPDLSTPLLSDTYGSKSVEFDQVWNDAAVKFIVGMIDEAGWNAAIDQWKKLGGDKIIDEFTAAYLKAKAK